MFLKTIIINIVISKSNDDRFLNNIAFSFANEKWLTTVTAFEIITNKKIKKKGKARREILKSICLFIDAFISLSK